MHYGHVTTVGLDSLSLALDLGGSPLPIACATSPGSRCAGVARGCCEAGPWTGGIFAVLGGALGFLAFRECDGDVYWVSCGNAGQRALAVVGAGATFGAVGFVIGAMTVRERWSVLINRVRP
jgi:hypothetical protein